jgi:hypothetical protein
MKNCIERLVERIAFSCKPGTCKPRRSYVALGKVWALKLSTGDLCGVEQPLT